MTTPKLITHASQATPEWLTSVLRYAGYEGQVSDVSMKSIGTGQVGENVRFTLAGEGIPESVVGKFASSDPTSKQTGIDQKNYIREVFYYKEIDSTVDIQTPRVLFTDCEESSHDFVIMMEDLAPGEQGDQLAGCSVDEAALALEELARLQGPRWGDSTLKQYPLLSGSMSEDNAGVLQGLYKMVEPGFLARYAERLTPEYLNMVKLVGDKLLSYSTSWEGPSTLIHIDYRLDNMMFGGPHPLTVVDWQSISLGCGLLDASYFVGTSLQPELRAKEERHLLKHYLDVLRSYKVELSDDDAFTFYRNFAPAGLIMA
ncbi:MAG: phosphotransferase, partial [Pseudomonadales bacterium]|nr:phosphotransferase [Pseudomonadales bacterium]